MKQAQLKAARFDQAKAQGLLGVKSKYDEDVWEDGHTSAWGSYYHKLMGWGYKCCYSFEKDSKCLGDE